jgi:hypothetical protein
MKRTREFYFLLLEYALIAIRASHDQGQSDHAAHLADIFHNVPGALRFPWTRKREEEVYAQLHDKARVYGLEEKLARWEQHALNCLHGAADPSRPPSAPPSPAAAP